ncbi:anthrax toxin receptor-like isoform X1 [Equus caballus]|uniref:anthrax toxin receptor-like isoform X1 n=1 Tax=Equus caballus TaxID=9796 RepID=UPI0038B3F691
MGSRGPRVPGPVLFLLLLLLPPPPLQSTESFPSRVPGNRDFHRKAGRRRRDVNEWKTCNGVFDIYFILDASDIVKDNWEDIHKFVNETAKKYKNPKLRMSFITYSTEGHTLMNLTSDRNEIHDGLDRLQNVVPSGDRNLQEGFKKANEQIQQVHSKDQKAASLIIALTAGPLQQKTVQDAKNEAKKAQKMGTLIYGVGVKDYEASQLSNVAGSKNQIYEARKGFKSLRDIIGWLVVNSCAEVIPGGSYYVCVGESYEVTFHLSSSADINKDEVICRYKLGYSEPFYKNATSVQRGSVVCPGHVFKRGGQEVSIQSSQDNGTFYEKPMTLVSITCPDATTVPKETSIPTTVTQKATVLTTVTQKKTTVTTTVTPEAPVPTVVTQKETSVPTTVTQKATPVPTVVTQKETPVPTVVTQKETPVPTTVTQKETSVPTVAPPGLSPDNPLFFPVLVPAVLIIPVLICCIWYCRRTVKEPPPVQKAEKEPETCPTVIVPWCGCQQDRIRRMEGKLDTLCNFVQSCNQVPLMWRDKGRCINFTLVKPPCVQMPCGSNICLRPSQESFPLNSCCSRGQPLRAICSRPASRMLPLIPPHAQALCRTTLSLPPP